MGRPGQGSPLDVAVTAAFGGSLLSDDLRGSPAAARAVLDEHAGDGPEVALLRGIVETLAGEPGAAAGHLRRAAEDGGDAVVRARGAAWGAAAAWLRANTFPGGWPAGGLEVTTRWADLADHPPPPDGAPPPHDLERDVLVRLGPRLRLVRLQLGTTLVAVDRPEAAREVLALLDRLADRAHQVGDLALAASLQRTAADLHHRSGDPPRGAELLAHVHREATARGDHAAAAACDLLRGDLALAPFSHPLAADLALVEGGTDTSELPVVVERAEADPAAVDLATATAAYDAAAAAYERAAAPRGLAAVELRRAGLARVAGDHARAVERADLAAAAAVAAGDGWLARTAQVHGLLARVGAGTSVTALPVPEELAAWGRSGGSFSYAFGLGLVLARAGRQWLHRAGDADRAATCHSLAGRLFEALDVPLQRSQSLADRAVIARAVGDTGSASRDLQRALDAIRGRLEDPRFHRDAWRRATSIGQRLHQLALAGQDAAALRRSRDRLADLVAAAPDLAPDDPTVGLDVQLRDDAADAVASTELHAMLAEGDAARDAGDTDAADERYRTALAEADSLGDALGRAVTLARLRRRDEAHDAYRQHAAAVEARQQATHAALVDALGSEAPPPLDTTGWRLRREAAFLTRTRLFEAAGASFDELDRHEPGWERADTRPWELLSEHGYVREQLDQHDRAAELHAAAVEALERRATHVARDEAKTALHAGSGRVFGRAARTALRRGDRGASFALAEQGRARALAELLSPSRAPSVGPTDEADPVAVWLAASARVALWQQVLATQESSGRSDDDLATRLQTAEADLATATDVLRAEAPEVAHAVTAPPPLTTDEVRRALAPGAALITHLVVDEDLLTYAVTDEGLVVAERMPVDARQLTRTLAAFAGACAGGGRWVDAGRAVADTLLTPVAEVVAAADQLTFVPTGVGHAAPLHALPWGDGILLERAAVAFLPSAATLPLLWAAEAPGVVPDLAGRRSLVVGDPDDMVFRPLGGGAPVPQRPLPFARAEAVTVARVLEDPVLLVGADATTAAVTAALPRAALVHLATHAYVDPEVPTASALLLARGDALRVVDLIGARLEADLVVLSACDSGRGQVTGGDEVISMTRALLAAGARSAVVSLWAVDDVSTSLLMTRFVAAVTAGATAATALRDAQQWYRGLTDRDRRDALDELAAGLPDGAVRRGLVAGGPPPVASAHPYHWAPFTYVGAQV